MRLTKKQVLEEIKRTTAANGGVPLGWRKFATETGIREPDWKKLWARWGDAVREAGFAPNEMTESHSESHLLEVYAKLALEMDRLPAPADMRLAAGKGAQIPDWNTFNRQFGGKQQLVAKLKEYCQDRENYASVVVLCEAYTPRGKAHNDEKYAAQTSDGYVYMVKHGSRREYRIGKTFDPLRREGELRVQLPERVEPVHLIETDDPTGIEAYWHNRFKDKRLNGDWFKLSAEDVRAFKRRRFM